MKLNQEIWERVIAQARRRVAQLQDAEVWLRAITRAVREVETTSFWALDGDTLIILSTLSGHYHRIEPNHRCRAIGPCLHIVARRLLIRYSNQLNQS